MTSEWKMNSKGQVLLGKILIARKLDTKGWNRGFRDEIDRPLHINSGTRGKNVHW